MKPLTILVIDDDRNLRLTLKELLEEAGYEVREADGAISGFESLCERQPDLALCDWKMPGEGGEQFLKRLKAAGLHQLVPVLVMTAHGTGPNAMTSMQLGAYDFITKPLDRDQLLATIARAIKHVELQREVDALKARRFVNGPLGEGNDAGQQRLIGSSSAWIEVFKAIGRVARTDVSVLLLGESGTGKELVARTIHDNSSRARKPFIVVNCAALPHDLAESELFGHERGSFTGAVTQKLGKFENAAGGSVFLDEIGELPLTLQPKLLRVLQERTFERVGGTASIQADFRIIAATNRVLEQEIEARTFRSDLFYRLKAFSIQLPPLRSRKADILQLAEYFLERYAQRNAASASGLTEDAMLILQQQSYPGNVRELEHMIERAAIYASGRAITREILEAAMSTAVANGEGRFAAWMQMSFHESVAAWERHLIEQALVASHGNKTEAARRLQIHRRLLYEKIEQLHISVQ